MNDKLKVRLVERGAFGSAIVQIAPGATFYSESGSMFRMSSNVMANVTTRPKGAKKGIMAGSKRMLAGDSFFISEYTISDNNWGEVGLAPTLAGDVAKIDLKPGQSWLCAGGSWLGSSDGVVIDTEWPGFVKGGFSGETPFFLKVSGSGPVLVSGYGSITELDVKDGITVDTGHLIAFSEGLDFKVGKAGKGLVSSFMSGEGLVLKFTGSGKILVQSHDADRFGGMLGPMLPPREG